MYFIRCNNNEQINKKLDKTNKPSIFHKGLSHGLSVLACVSPKRKGCSTPGFFVGKGYLHASSGILKLSMAEV